MRHLAQTLASQLALRHRDPLALAFAYGSAVFAQTRSSNANSSNGNSPNALAVDLIAVIRRNKGDLSANSGVDFAAISAWQDVGRVKLGTMQREVFYLFHFFFLLI